YGFVQNFTAHLLVKKIQKRLRLYEEEQKTTKYSLYLGHPILLFNLELTVALSIKQMLAHLIQAIFACSHTIFRSIINITLYSLLSRIFLNWFRFNSFVTFLCTAWCITKITKYIRRLWLNARLQNKKPTEKILVNELIWKSDDNNDNENDFKDNWNKLIKDEYEHFFSGVVRIPFENGWVCIGVMVIVNYLTNNAGFSYLSALFRTVSCVVL
ncbi:unnamed protein product, partial [Didymodactylos carnosus]